MAKTKLNANGVIDTLTPDEHDQILGKHLDRAVKDFFQEEARGYSTAPIIAIGSPDGSGDLLLPAAAANKVGPKGGFAWKVERLTAVGLGAGDTVLVLREDTVIDTLTDTRATIYPGKGMLVRGNQTIRFVGAGMTATGEVVITGDAIETAEPDMYKML